MSAAGHCRWHVHCGRNTATGISFHPKHALSYSMGLFLDSGCRPDCYSICADFNQPSRSRSELAKGNEALSDARRASTTRLHCASATLLWAHRARVVRMSCALTATPIETAAQASRPTSRGKKARRLFLKWNGSSAAGEDLSRPALHASPDLSEKTRCR